MAHFLDVSPSSDHSSLFWPWKKKAERKERDTLTGFPFVRLMVWGRRRERVQGEGAGFKMGVSVVGAGASNGCPPPPISLCYSPERWRARQDLINDQWLWIGLCKVWKNSSFHHKFKAEKNERLSKKRVRKRDFSALFLLSSFCSFPRSLISWVAPLSSPPWLSAWPEQSLGILEFPLCSCSWLTYLFNYFTVCLLFKRRGPCCFFPSALLFKTQAFHVGSGLPGLMAVTSTFDLPWPPRRVWYWAKQPSVCINSDKGCITHYCFKHLERLPWEQELYWRPSQVVWYWNLHINPLMYSKIQMISQGCWEAWFCSLNLRRKYV